MHQFGVLFPLDERTGKTRQIRGAEFQIRTQRLDGVAEQLTELFRRPSGIAGKQFRTDVDDVVIPHQERFGRGFLRRIVVIGTHSVPPETEIGFDQKHFRFAGRFDGGAAGIDRKRHFRQVCRQFSRRHEIDRIVFERTDIFRRPFGQGETLLRRIQS